MKIRWLGAVLALFPLFPVHAADGGDAAARGLRIAREADNRASGYGDMQADLRMVLISKRGETSERDLAMKVLEGKGDEGDKSLVVFEKPRDVRGTALLTWSHPNSDDEQWLYLPALRRVKTIASRNKSGPFMGSEFAYEDMRPQAVEKFTYKYLRQEPCGKLTCYVIERFPKDDNSGYTREVAWIDTDQYRTWKVDYYDRKRSLLKTLTSSDFKQYKGRWWRARTMSMVNHQTGKGTDLHWSNYRFGTGLSDADFNRNSLKRAH